MTDVQADKNLALEQAKKELEEELGHTPTKKELHDSAAYQGTISQWNQVVQDTEAEIRGTEDGKVKDTHRAETIHDPGTPTVTREVGKATARENFMGWATSIMYDPAHPDADVVAKVKAHFMGIQPADDGTILAADAAGRYNLARTAFADEHEQSHQTMLSPRDAMSMRDRHEGRFPPGKQGHPLGLAMDFEAYDSPNLTSTFAGHKDAALNEYLISRIGGGRAHMEVNNDAIVAMGQRAAAGALTDKDRALEQNIEDQYTEMDHTSKRLQGSLSDTKKKELDELRQQHFNGQAERDRLAELKRKAGKGKTTAEITQLQDTIDKEDLAMKAALRGSFGGWISTIEGDEAKSQADLQGAEADEAGLKAAKVPLNKMSDTELSSYVTANHLKARADFKGSDDAYIKALNTERQHRISSDDKKEKYAQGEMKAHAAVIDKLTSPEQVFGDGVRENGRWKTQARVADPSVMQLVEKGFVRNDDKPNADGKIFNAETVGTLARFGFAPGSTFGDTQHFDFVEGQRAVITNSAGTYGPTGAHEKKK